MRRQAGIVHGFDLRFWLRGQKFGDALRVFRMRADAVRKSLKSAQGQPALKRRRHSAAFALNAADFFQPWTFIFEDQSAHSYVAVAGEILGNRVHYHIDAKAEWELEERSSPGVIASHHGPNFSCQCYDGPQVGNVEQRVEGVSVQMSARGRRDRSFHRGQVLHIDQGMLEAPVRHYGAEQDGRTVISVFGGDDVVSGRERLKYRERGRAAGRECQRSSAFFQGRQRMLKAFTIGIIGTAIEVSAGKGAIVGLMKRGGEVDGGHNVA